MTRGIKRIKRIKTLRKKWQKRNVIVFNSIFC